MPDGLQTIINIHKNKVFSHRCTSCFIDIADFKLTAPALNELKVNVVAISDVDRFACISKCDLNIRNPFEYE